MHMPATQPATGAETARHEEDGSDRIQCPRRAIVDVLVRYPVPAGSGQGLRVKVISDVPDRAEAQMRADLKQRGISEVHLAWAPPIPLAGRTSRGGPVTSPGDDHADGNLTDRHQLVWPRWAWFRSWLTVEVTGRPV
jgi:hypothetical protein